MFVISSNNRLRVLFDKIATVYFSGKIYLYFSTGNGQPREPCSIVPVGSAHFRSVPLPGRLQTVLQFRALSQTYGSSSFDMRHVWTLNRITSHWTRPCGRRRTSWLREGVGWYLCTVSQHRDPLKKEESFFKVKSWTVIVCCPVLTYVRNYANAASIQCSQVI